MLQTRLSRPRLTLVVTFIGTVLTACATAPGRTTAQDPWAGFNRRVHAFNDGLDRAVIKPTAKAYKNVTPQWLRTGIGRVFAHVGYPTTMVNQLLQGKPKEFVQDTCRFVTNTVFGLGGLFDVADHVGLPAHDEDFGQTLARWGVPSGPYLVLPLLGPSTARDGPSKIADYFMSVTHHVDLSTEAEWGLRALDIVDTRAGLLSTDATLDSAYDKYGVMRDAWIQRREYQIFDGDPPVDEMDEKFDEEDTNDEKSNADTDDGDAAR